MNPKMMYAKNNEIIIKLPINDLFDYTGLVLGTGKKENKSKLLNIFIILDGCLV